MKTRIKIAIAILLPCSLAILLALARHTIKTSNDAVSAYCAKHQVGAIFHFREEAATAIAAGLELAPLSWSIMGDYIYILRGKGLNPKQCEIRVSQKKVTYVHLQ